jgi:hypothetical protein
MFNSLTAKFLLSPLALAELPHERLSTTALPLEVSRKGAGFVYKDLVPSMII